MTQHSEQVRIPASVTEELDRLPGSPAPRSWWRRPWMIPLALLVAAFLYMSWPVYLTLDPAQSLIPINETFTPHYSLLLAHITLGTIAIVTVVLQVWPWLRRTYPTVHRTSGRLYVFAGIIPSALLSLAIMPFGMLTGIGAIGSSVWTILALGTTIAGYQMARQHRWAEHRKFMLYSFALATSILTGRLMFNAAWYGALLFPSYELNVPVVAQLAGFWLNWILNLGLVYWWLRRTARKSAARSAATV
ncbi:DUF2306 domain-containing protein [Actinokineospora sp.]|uniref:DUF2306 domain-containing protein n=1 Tax=Actinokineospora sp. TaxID=1872133 RepID=UPI00403801B6